MQHTIEAHNKKELGLIILENQPYTNTGDTTNKSNKKKTASGVKKQGLSNGVNGNSLNDLSNQFIWSAIKYHNPEHLIIYTPVKY